MTDPTTGPTSPPPYSDHGAPGRTDAAGIAAETMRRTAEQAAHEQMRAEFLRDLPDPAQEHARPVTPGARVEIAVDGLAMPKHTRGDALRPIGLVGDPPTLGWEVLLENGISMVYRGTDLRVIDETPEAKAKRQRAEFLRDLTSGGPVSCGPLPPLPSGAYAPFPRGPACCGPALPAEPDDRVTDDLRDLIATQSLAMASARTRQGAAMAAMVVLTAAKGDAISDALARGLRTVLGGVGDLFDGVDLDGVVRQVIAQSLGVPPAAPAPTQRPAGEGQTIVVGVQVDGKTVGTVTVPVFATEADVARVIEGDALILSKIPAGCPVDVVYVPGKIVRIVTRPVPAAESGTVG